MTGKTRLPRVPLLCLPLTAAFALALLALTASAHEHASVAPYNFTVGWRIEPAVVGSVNGLDLRVERNDSNTTTPVLGAAGSLTATISSGGASTPKAIQPQEDRDGWYTFDIIPSRQGAYSVRVTGDLNGTAINFSVDLDPPLARSSLEFPVADPTPTDLSSEIASNATALNSLSTTQAALAARIAAVEARPAGGDAAAAASTASTAMLLGVAGLIAGAAGAGMGALAWRRPRPKA